MKNIVSAPIPKYYQIKELLHGEIKKGRWQPGKKLPSFRELSKHFSVTLVTIGKAIEALRQDGIVYSVQGQGTFVAKTDTKPAKEKRAGLVMTVAGEVFGPIFGKLTSSLGENNYQTLVSNIPLGHKTIAADKTKKFEQLLDADLDVLFIDGEVFLPFKNIFALQSKVGNLTFLHRFETTMEFLDANVIEPDWHQAGYLGAEHLLENGCQQLIFLTFPFVKSSPPDMGPDYLYHHGVLTGIREVAEKNNLSKGVEAIVDRENEVPEELVAALAAEGRTGVICMGDFRAPKVYQVAQSVGKKIGEDILVIGFNNTSWSEMLSPPLTSISINEEEIAELAVKSAIENWQGKRIKVSPELIARESSKRLRN